MKDGDIIRIVSTDQITFFCEKPVKYGLVWEIGLYSWNSNRSIAMGGEVYQAQIVKNFFDTITGTDRNLTRIFMCVVSLAKIRMEPPENSRF